MVVVDASEMNAPPRFSDVSVDLTDQLEKPVACVALVRRALQKAGHHLAAREFTDEALATPNEDFLDLARRWVQVVV